MSDDRLLSAGLMAGAILLLGVAAIIMLRAVSARELETRVLSATRGQARGAADADTPPIGIRRLLFWVGKLVRGRTRVWSERDILVLEGMIAGSGMNPAQVLPMILGLKAMLVFAVPGLAFAYGKVAGLTGNQQLLLLCLAIPIGMLGPEWALAWLRRPYLASLRRGIPDALDLLVVCSEAGMGLENALAHVSQEIRHSNPAISVALAKLLDELLVLPDRREAFRNFAERTGVEGARRLATIIGQAMRYGTPLSRALRTIAVDLRRERLLALETKAARLPVLLILPLIFCIMPSMFIVVAGPSMLRLTDTLHQMAVRTAPHPKPTP